jgi:hypothetical protein
MGKRAGKKAAKVPKPEPARAAKDKELRKEDVFEASDSDAEEDRLAGQRYDVR